MFLEQKRRAGVATLNIASADRASPQDGPPLILLHGVTRCWQDFSSLLPMLPAGFRVFAVDLRGHGDSSREETYLVRDYVEDIAALVRSFEQPCVLFGHSLGAMAALGAAAAEPNAIRAIILEDPPMHTMGRRISETSWRAFFSAVQALALKGGTEDELFEQLGAIAIPQPDGRMARLRDLRSEASLRFSAFALSRLDPRVLTSVVEGRWLDGFDFEDACRRVLCPALLLQADPDCGGALKHADAELIHKNLRDCVHVPFAQRGHLLHATEPQRVLDAVRTFIGRAKLLD